MEQEKKFLFDVNVFDAPPKEEVVEDLPPPPPTFSEDELAASKDIAFEQGRQKGQREQVESREQYIAQSLEQIAGHFSHLFAAETLRENIFERESLKLALSTLDVLFPLLNEKIGREEVKKVIEKTLTEHRKTKEILIYVPTGMAGEVDALISRIRKDEHEPVLWRVLENAALKPGDCTLEWSDGGAVRDSSKTARDIRKALESLLGAPHPIISEMPNSDVQLTKDTESEGTQPLDTVEKIDE